MSHTSDLKTRLNEMGLIPKKAFGQNFLISQHVIDKIVHTVVQRKFNDLVEIGPGLGALTEPLLTAGLKPHAIEFDPQLAEYWKSRGLSVTAADALQLDWDELKLKAPALLVSNLPYQISTSLVIDRCFGPQSLETMVLMFQKEVAQRLTASAQSREYGFLSVMAQLHFKISKVSDAAPGDFFPPPKIASRVLLFERVSTPDLGQPFFRFVKQAFAFRRKFLIKNLKGVVNKAGLERLPSAFEACELSIKARAEELTPTKFVELFKKVYER